MIFLIKFPNSEIALGRLYQYTANEVNESCSVVIVKKILMKTIIFMNHTYNRQYPLRVLDLEQPSRHTF